jgi:hypothetical protein
MTELIGDDLDVRSRELPLPPVLGVHQLAVLLNELVLHTELARGKARGITMRFEAVAKPVVIGLLPHETLWLNRRCCAIA